MLVIVYPSVIEVASFPGSSPAFCRILKYSMGQKAGEEPGNERYNNVSTIASFPGFTYCIGDQKVEV